MTRFQPIVQFAKILLIAAIVLSALTAWLLALIGQYGQVELLVQHGRNVRLLVYTNCVVVSVWDLPPGKDVDRSGNLANGIHLNLSPPLRTGVDWIIPGMEWNLRGSVGIVVSHWLLSLSTGALALSVLSRIVYRRAKWHVRVKADRCPNCGYDLRATPEPCPECGYHPTSVKPAIVTE